MFCFIVHRLNRILAKFLPQSYIPSISFILQTTIVGDLTSAIKIILQLDILIQNWLNYEP